MSVSKTKKKLASEVSERVEYFYALSALSKFLAVHMEHDSTIMVEQYKSKFNSVRVYCTLVDENKLIERWENSPEIEGNEIPDYFRTQCLQRDCIAYRRAYYDALHICPQFKDEMFSYADYPVLLFDIKALTEYKEQIKESPLPNGSHPWKSDIKFLLTVINTCQ